MAGGGHIKHKNYWKFHSYKGINSGYDMLCEPVNSDQEEKEGDVLNSNRIINLKNLISNIDNFWCAKNVHRGRNYRKIRGGKRRRKLLWFC